MDHWMWAVSLVGILSTAVVWGTDMFFSNDMALRRRGCSLWREGSPTS